MDYSNFEVLGDVEMVLEEINLEECPPNVLLVMGFIVSLQCSFHPNADLALP